MHSRNIYNNKKSFTILYIQFMYSRNKKYFIIYIRVVHSTNIHNNSLNTLECTLKNNIKQYVFVTRKRRIKLRCITRKKERINFMRCQQCTLPIDKFVQDFRIYFSKLFLFTVII